MKQLLVGILIICFSTSALAADFVLLKKGLQFTPSEDMHCMSNATILNVITKLRLCKDECKIRLEEAVALKNVEIQFLETTLSNKEILYKQVIDEKDRTLRQIEEVTLTKISESGNSWWKISLAVAGGVVLGAGAAALVVYAGK